MDWAADALKAIYTNHEYSNNQLNKMYFNDCIHFKSMWKMWKQKNAALKAKGWLVGKNR